MPKKIAVVMSGCGPLDGSEIHETVAALLAISRSGATYQGVAPDRDQHQVINHVTEQEDTDASPRNMLKEAARIVRGDVVALDKADISDYDAVIFPGGFGAAKNLFDFALKGDNTFTVQPDVVKFVEQAKTAGKPIGFICVSPVMIPKLFDNPEMTIGTSDDVAAVVESLGAKHHKKNADEICIDYKNNIVSTPAYMLGKNIDEVATGIEKLVQQVIKMCS